MERSDGRCVAAYLLVGIACAVLREVVGEVWFLTEKLVSNGEGRYRLMVGLAPPFFTWRTNPSVIRGGFHCFVYSERIV